MKRILKYRLPIDGGVITITDKVVNFLKIHTQNGWPHIWAIVDDEMQASHHWEIVAWGTGWDVPEELETCGYLGTAVDKAGYVWHYFSRSYQVWDTTVNWDYMNQLAGTSAGNPVDLYSINITCDGADATIAQKDLRPYTLTVEGSISTPEWAYGGTARTINCSNRVRNIDELISKALAETQCATACASSVR